MNANEAKVRSVSARCRQEMLDQGVQGVIVTLSGKVGDMVLVGPRQGANEGMLEILRRAYTAVGRAIADIESYGGEEVPDGYTNDIIVNGGRRGAN